MCAQRRLRSAWASAQSDQSSLCAQWVVKNPSFLHVDSEYSDQTWRMHRLIWVFAGRTCHFVGFVVRRLTCFFILVTGVPMDCPLCSVSSQVGRTQTISSVMGLVEIKSWRSRDGETVKRHSKTKWVASWQNQQNDPYAQRRLRSAWTSAQSDQSLRCALNG